MKDADKEQFANLITDVMSYYKQSVSLFTMGLFWNACQGFEFEQIQAAVEAHCKDPERGHAPLMVSDLVRILQGTPTDRSMIAWGAVQGAMEQVGAYQDVIFDDPAIHAAVADCGGWTKICRCRNQDLSYLQHQFTQAYRAYVNKGEFAYPRVLSGERSPDSWHQARGLPVPKPAIVGNQQLALGVFQKGLVGTRQVTFTSLQELLAMRQEALPLEEARHD